MEDNFWGGESACSSKGHDFPLDFQLNHFTLCKNVLTWQAKCFWRGFCFFTMMSGCPSKFKSFLPTVSQIHLSIPFTHWSICHLLTTSYLFPSFHLFALREVRLMVLICVDTCVCPLSVPYWLRHSRPTHSAVSPAATHTHITDDKISKGP